MTEMEDRLKMAIQVQPEFLPHEVAGSLHCRRWGAEVWRMTIHAMQCKRRHISRRIDNPVML
jgi:hypothetical protein